MEPVIKRGPGRPRKNPVDPVASATETTHSEPAVDQANDGPPERPRRISLADRHRDVLTVEKQIPGYTLRWVSDRDNRIQRFREAGWTFVHDDPRKGRVAVGEQHVDAMRQTGSVVSKQVGMDQFGKPRIQYLMAQRVEWYEEDQAFKNKKIDEVMEQIRRQDKEAGITLDLPKEA